MIIALYTSGGHYMSDQDFNRLSAVLDKHSVECYFNSDCAISSDKFERAGIKTYCCAEDLPSDVKLVVSYGGDGTFLKCVNMFFESNIPIMGVNSGRLGFLATINKDNIEHLLEEVVNGNYSLEHRTQIYSPQLSGCALNELTVQKKGLSMLNFGIVVDGEEVANYMADGVIVSTATGSTAYSLSVGGAIISPNCNCFMICPIAPHNLNLRPLVVDDNSEISVKVGSRRGEVIATLDNREYQLGEDLSEIFINKAEKTVTLAKLNNITFFETLKEKLMWGMDTRNK